MKQGIIIIGNGLVKKKYDIWMCMPGPGKNVTNFLEGSHYVTNENKPFVLSGTVGECWTVDAKKLFKTYRLFGGQPLTGGQMKQGRQTTPRPNTRVL